MRLQVTRTIGACLLTLFLQFGAQAGSMLVEPVLMEIQAPSATSSVKLSNNGAEPITAQIRVFRWSQVNGRDRLEPTNDVVASPPVVQLGPNGKNLVRVVRVSKAPVAVEESYRLLIDQLPNRAGNGGKNVNLLIRQSIPVFFRPTGTRPANISWWVATKGGQLFIMGQNQGGSRARIAGLEIRNSKGKKISLGNGLVGYVLNRSTVVFPHPAAPSGFGSGARVTLTARTEDGTINAAVTIAKAR
jgi:fimbrial chaperone protein